MRSRMVVILMLFVLIGSVTATLAGELSFKDGDTLQTALEAQKGKIVTVRLTSGEELTGRVRNTSKELLQLGELAGKEYYDALVVMSKISAMIVRVK